MTNASESRPRGLVRPGRILFVDDEEAILRVMSRALEREGHEVITAQSGEAALGALDALHADAIPFDAIVTDLGMPGITGLELLRAIRRRDLDVPVLILTGSPSVETAIEAMEYGAMQYLVKPVPMERMGPAVLRAVRLGRLARTKRDALRATPHDGLPRGMHGAGDRAGLEASFDRMMTGVWPAYQPIVRRDGTLYGYEALLRSEEPALAHPGAVLDAADKLGRGKLLGQRMRALATAPIALDASRSVLFVNLHPDDLFDDELLDPRAPLSTIASRVVLEVTERAAIKSMERLRYRIAEIRERGFRLAIDDLGAGYAGLGAFAALEPEVVKLDMSLIRDIERAPTQRKIVRAMTVLCHDLGIEVVAEGIETIAEFEVVLDAGCDLFQGFLFAKPGPAFPSFSWPRP